MADARPRVNPDYFRFQVHTGSPVFKSHMVTVSSHPTATSFENNELLQVYAVGTDSAIWLRRKNGGSWAGWESLGGTFLSPPASVARHADNAPTRDIVALGTDHALWHFEMFDP